MGMAAVVLLMCIIIGLLFRNRRLKKSLQEHVHMEEAQRIIDDAQTEEPLTVTLPDDLRQHYNDEQTIELEHAGAHSQSINGTKGKTLVDKFYTPCGATVEGVQGAIKHMRNCKSRVPCHEAYAQRHATMAAAV